MILLRRTCFNVLTVSFAGYLLGGCGSGDCAPMDVSTGDELKFTVLDAPSREGPCSLLHPELAPGDEFILVVGSYQAAVNTYSCPTYAAKPPAPGDWGVATKCVEFDHQLGLTCSWTDCEEGFAEFLVVGSIFGEAERTSDGEVVIVWTRARCDPLFEHGKCTERYPVKIERL